MKNKYIIKPTITVFLVNGLDGNFAGNNACCDDDTWMGMTWRHLKRGLNDVGDDVQSSNGALLEGGEMKFNTR